MKRWTRTLVATDITDPATGKPLYAWTRIRPRWYWALCRLRLFLGIVWRPGWGIRMGWRAAWDVSKMAQGITWKGRQT